MKTAEVKEYFLKNGLASEVLDVKEIEGGIHNGVYLVETNEKKFVFKKHLEKSKTFPDITLPGGRYENERNAYRLLSSLFPRKINPQIFRFDDENQIIIMEYLEEENRLDKKLKEIDSKIFYQIGKTLAEIEKRTYDNEELKSKFNNIEFQELKYQYRYYQFISNSALFEIRDSLMKRTRENRKVFVHGDPRLNNLFIQKDKFYFIDYEGAYYASVGLDVAYLLSELLIYYFNEPSSFFSQMIKDFWNGYRSHAKIAENFEEIENDVVLHSGFALLDKLVGIIRNDYAFVTNPVKLVEVSEKIIISPEINKVEKILELA